MHMMDIEYERKKKHKWVGRKREKEKLWKKVRKKNETDSGIYDKRIHAF